MLWRSVVGKLWLTILLLVSAVLFFLTLLLLQFFENFHVSEVEQQMQELSAEISRSITSFDALGNPEKLKAASKIGDIYGARVIVLGKKGDYWISPRSHKLPGLPPSVFKKQDQLKEVLTSGETRTFKGPLAELDGRLSDDRLIIVGSPVKSEGTVTGAVYVYQSLDVIQQTTDRAKNLIYISAGIAIILTTIFAFFLSTRITAPLRDMRRAAMEVAEGRFNQKLPVLSNDEIGELASVFNRMGSQLDQNIQALNQEKEQLSGILRSMADGVMTFNKEGKLLITNPPAEAFLKSWRFEQSEGAAAEGSESEEGHQHSEKVPGSLGELFKKVTDAEEEQTAEVTSQGRTWVILMTPLYNEKDIRGAVAVLRDMTEERQMNEMRQGFIANVSHELRTPIAMLQGYSEAIVDDVAGSEDEKKEIARIIYDESKRMGRLVNELLDLARLEAGYFQLNEQDISLGEFMERTVGKFSGLAKDAGVALELKGHLENDRIMHFDPDRIEQVLTNLIDNAIRHTPDHGVVEVRVTTGEKEVTVEVADTGKGIAESDLPFVFERFYKADKARTRGKAGTGLGLSIAKNIVEAHGGQISVRSKADKGTTFMFTLPKETL